MDDWQQQRECEERYYTEPFIFNWTQADIDRHNELRRLHAVTAELLEALQQSWRGYAPPSPVQKG